MKLMRAKKVNEEKEINKNIHHKHKVLAIDFDGVIHSYISGWTGQVPRDLPMEGVENALIKLKEDGWILMIFSTRKSEYIEDWLKKYDLDKYFSGITNKKIPAKLYIDDRGYHFKNWENTLEDIKNINNEI